MTRAYLRLDPGFYDRKESYPDGALAALIAVLCFAEHQPLRGTFKSRRLLKALLDRRARHLAYLFDHGDILELPDGSVYVDGWREWQEGDWKVGERIARIRNRKHNGVTPSTVTPGVTPTVYTPLSVSAGGAVHSAGGATVVAVAPMNPERAQSVLDDPYADPEAKEGAKAYLELKSRFGKRQPSRIGA